MTTTERVGEAQTAADPTAPLNLHEWQARAQAMLPPNLFEFVAGGAEDERTLSRNRAAFARWALRPRILTGARTPDLCVTTLGESLSMPVLLAPTGGHGLHPQAELAVVRAAASAGTLTVVSTAATFTVEEIAEAARGPLWFQLYVYQDRALTASLVQRAADAGYRAICLTADVPVLGRREREMRDRFQVRRQSVRRNLPDDAGPLAAHLCWDDVAWLRSLSPLPLIVKGVLRGDDAALAVEHGAAAVIVSNHGGRQLDGAPATLDVLEEVVRAVAGRCEVYLDGGVRRGTDILTALALGARAVLIGRPYLWGLSVAGEAGVRGVLGCLETELRTALTLCGLPDLASIDRTLVMRTPEL